jgi:hypothetical protein
MDMNLLTEWTALKYYVRAKRENDRPGWLIHLRELVNYAERRRERRAQDITERAARFGQGVD